MIIRWRSYFNLPPLYHLSIFRDYHPQDIHLLFYQITLICLSKISTLFNKGFQERIIVFKHWIKPCKIKPYLKIKKILSGKPAACPFKRLWSWGIPSSLQNIPVTGIDKQHVIPLKGEKIC